MKKFGMVATAFMLWAVSQGLDSRLVAQEAPKFPPPTKEHEWLKQFIGEWESEMEAKGAPGQPAVKCKGTIVSRAMGGYWVVNDMKSEMMGQTMSGTQTLGYDATAKKYVGTWIDTMCGFLWKYEGSVDESGKILTLEAMGPNFLQEGKSAKFRDIFEFKSKDEIVLTTQMQGEDGKWITFMTGVSKRKK